jgi:hypothetical protein
MATILEMTEALNHYLAACESRNVAVIAECFSANAIIEDPTSDRVVGLDSIRGYFRGLYEGLASLRLSTDGLYWRGNAAACLWRGHAVRYDGTVVNYEGIDVLVLDKDLKIAQMSAYWDPKEFTNPTKQS